MKITGILLTIACLQVSAESFSQKIRFSGTEVPLDEVFSAIEKQSEYFFFYRYGDIQRARPVTLRMENASVEEVLEICLKGQPFTWSIEGKTIVISRTPPAPTSARPAVQPKQELEVSGVVRDTTGNVLPGVTVQVKNTDRAVATDEKGLYKIEVAGDDPVLVFSYLGYISQEIAVDGQAVIDVVMHEDAASLEEVVVVGYGTAKKRDLTGAVTRVDLSQNRYQPNVNPVQNLRGTVAGVSIIDNGRPGSDGSIRIRGANSISANNDPLIVLDGIIYSGGSLSDINSNDIESIDILKDASSSAIYGSLAANGVILITTKKGSTDKPRISLNSYYGFSDFAHIPKYLDAEKYLQVRKDAEEADGGPIPFSPLEQANIDAGITIDPFEEIRQDAPLYSNELSVSGRTTALTYYISGSHTSIKSPVMGDHEQSLHDRPPGERKGKAAMGGKVKDRCSCGQAGAGKRFDRHRFRHYRSGPGPAPPAA
ncbi:MAG TPA: TonB-dependent receptor plug domain-containing protein [Anseongella sp.]|nr:TonB-dependent receptor plug domain-containing protein [Anseongella sp.]